MLKFVKYVDPNISFNCWEYPKFRISIIHNQTQKINLICVDFSKFNENKFQYPVFFQNILTQNIYL